MVIGDRMSHMASGIWTGKGCRTQSRDFGPPGDGMTVGLASLANFFFLARTFGHDRIEVSAPLSDKPVQ